MPRPTRDDRIPLRVAPMLATLVDRPFQEKGRLYEEKYDGQRILADKEARRVTRLSRNANDRTASFADVAHDVARLAPRTLLLDAFRAGQLHYVGKVGTRFSEERLESLWRSFRPLVRRPPALADPPRARGHTCLEPRLVAQVSYTEWTADRKLRPPVLLGLRDAKSAAARTLPQSAP